MALSNYTELQASIASWLHRTDLTGQIPDFIAMAESRINTLLNVPAMETESALSTSIGLDYAALPSRFVEEIACYITLSGVMSELTHVAPASFTGASVNGMPQYYAIDGENVRFDCPLDAAYTITLRYKQGFDLAATSTNWLMTKYPRVYLYGSQVEAAIYTRDPAAMTIAEQAFQQSLSEINKGTRNDSSLRVDDGIATSSVWSILRGW